MKFAPLAFATGMASIDVVALSIMKNVFNKSLSPGFAAVAMVLYSLQPLVLWKALSYESVIVMNILWDLISDVLVTLVGVFFLGEVLGYRKWLGIALGMLSMYLISHEDASPTRPRGS